MHHALVWPLQMLRTIDIKPLGALGKAGQLLPDF